MTAGMQVEFEGPAGRLEGVLWGSNEPRAVVAVCHPHPLHGGSLRSNVVHRIARGFEDAGLAVLRFNFRGVGGSAGVHDGHGAEEGDLAAALAELGRRYPGAARWAAGFSFGARTVTGFTAGEGAGAQAVERVALVALPVSAYPCDAAAELRTPGLALMAERDEFGTLAALRERFPGLAERLELQEIPATDHFFSGALDEVRARIADWARRSLRESETP